VNGPRIALAVTLVALLAGPAQADSHRVYLRGGVVHVMPFSSSSELELSGVEGPASLALQDGPVAGSGTAVDSMTTAGLTIGYRIPAFGDRLAIETVLAPPLHLRFHGTGTLADESIAPDALGIPTGVPALGPELGEARGAPPILIATWRLLDSEAFQPHIGLGGTVLLAYDAKMTNPTLVEMGRPRLRIEPAPGLVAQAGLDARIWRRLRGRIDVKYVAFMTTRATVDDLRVRTPELPLFEAVEVGSATMEVTLNPVIVQAGVGADFW
jgi:outer membrane protein W